MTAPKTDHSVLDFTADNGVPFRARVVLPGDDYGAFRKGEWALKAEPDAKPLIEFYDQRHNHGPHGQFVSRYYLETLQESVVQNAKSQSGLDLFGGEPSWKLDNASVAQAVEWAQAHVDHRQAHPLDAMAIGYIKAAIFTTMDDNDRPLDRRFSTDSVGPDVRAAAKEACDAFRDENKVLVAQALAQPDYSEARLGNDFWMTRNGHGTGFWDRDELAVTPPASEIGKGATLGDALAEMANQAKPVDLVLGDDGALDFQPLKRKALQP